MYTTTVGKTFLKEYNRRNEQEYSAREFFDEVLFKTIFDHKRYLMWVQNSPFVQGIGKKKPFFSSDERESKLSLLHEKIGRGDRDASIAIGFPASEAKEYATTSGLVTDLTIPSEDQEIYYSWIGSALSLGVAGGYAILFDDPEITYTIFEGWTVYRKYLEDPALNQKLRSNQLTTWNGQWLAYRYNEFFNPRFRFQDLSRKEIFSISESKIEVNTVNWSKLFFSLSTHFPAESIIAYVFALGQTNKTIGFIPFQFQTGQLLHEVYQKLFGEDEYKVNKQDFETLYGRHIKRACELGNIGLQALEPQNLRKYFADSANLKLVKPNLDKKGNETDATYEERKANLLNKDHSNITTYRTYKTWLTAMISKNKTEISDYTQEIAAALVKYRDGGRKNDRKNLLETQLFAKKSKSAFLEALIEVISNPEVEIEIVEKIKTLRDRIHFMSREDFTYFILLLKFDYAYQERIS